MHTLVVVQSDNGQETERWRQNMEAPFSKEAELLFEESLRDHAIGTFTAQCPGACGWPWAVEFKCGKCCKKACNARVVGICNGLLLLAPFDRCGVVIKLFGEEGVIDTEYARFVLIPLENVCSIEIGILPVPNDLE